MESDAGLAVNFRYNTDLFDDDTVRRWAGHYRTLLEGIVADPDRSISELPLLIEGERHQILVEWNNTRVDYPEDLCLHQLFEAQVERTPDAVAAVYEGSHLTYRDLNARANQLAHYLQRLGVAPDVLVGMAMERSLEMVIGLLGILKAGGVYVPLDPAYPRERLSLHLGGCPSPGVVDSAEVSRGPSGTRDGGAPGQRLGCHRPREQTKANQLA